jgi:hypothetical protein
MRIIGGHGDVAVDIRRSAGEEGNPALASLYSAADELYWERVMARFSVEFKKDTLGTGAVNWTTATNATFNVFPAPTSQWWAIAGPTAPTEEQCKKFFTLIAGEWLFNYAVGNERAQITADGTYHVMNPSGRYATAPTFKLRLLDCKPDLSKVEMEKAYPAGSRMQVEVLDVTLKEMNGVTKDGEIPLQYKKIR